MNKLMAIDVFKKAYLLWGEELIYFGQVNRMWVKENPDNLNGGSYWKTEKELWDMGLILVYDSEGNQLDSYNSEIVWKYKIRKEILEYE